MRKGIIFFLLIIFVVSISLNQVEGGSVPATPASSGSGITGGVFGGRVVNTKAIEIQMLEESGFQCMVPGTSITILPLGSPTGTPISYLIPIGVTSRTRNSIDTGQLILGKYFGQVAITCVYPSLPPVITSVGLSTITLFGTSKGFGFGSQATAIKAGPASQ